MSKSYLPENQSYIDKGCSLHSHCLTCPFETCRFDEPNHTKGRGQANMGLIAELSASGMSYAEIAAALNLSSRTIRRLTSV